MFSIKIVGSDAFLEMPTSSRELYFQLGMYADDDGFVNPRKIMRMIGSSNDDLKMLIAKRFVLSFENGVIVIKHWRVNNMVRKDFYQPTEYLEQKRTLFVKENKVYTDDPKTDGIVNKLSPQVRLGKDSKYMDFSSKEIPNPINTEAVDKIKAEIGKMVRSKTFGAQPTRSE